MTNRIRIVIADDHDMLRKGISVFLDTTPDFELVGEATTGSEAIYPVPTSPARHRPDGFTHARDGWRFRYSSY